MELLFGRKGILDRIVIRNSNNELLDPYHINSKKGFLLIELGNAEHFRLYFIKNGKVNLLGNNFFVFQDEGFLELEKDNKKLYHSTEVGRYITVFRNEDLYINLLNAVGKESFFSALKKLREYSYLSNKSPEKNFFKGLSMNKLFISQTNEKQFKYLSGVGYERFLHEFFDFGLGNVVRVFTASVPLKGKGRLELELNFESKAIVESEVFALIGKNGVGKTQSLKALKKEALKDQSFKKIIDINLLGSINKVTGPDSVSLRIDSISKINFLSSIRNLLVERKKYHYFDSLKILREFFVNDLGCSEVLIPFTNGKYLNLWDDKFYPNSIDLDGRIKFLKNGQEFILSQGQNYLTSLILLLLLHIEQYSLVLIDEPEMFLHPNLIKRAQNILQKLLKDTKSKAVLSTHSIFLVRELPKEFVLIIYSQDNLPFSRVPQKETFGASLDRLADEIFYDDEVETSFDRFVLDYKKKNPKTNINELKKLPAGLAARILAND